jgi:uncharacterized protein (TIGR02271 family)
MDQREKTNRTEDFYPKQDFNKQEIRIEENHAHVPENRSAVQDTVVPVIEETVEIGKRVVETGKVRVSKSVHEEEVTVDLLVTREEVEVERVPVNQYVETPPPPVRYEGDAMIIPVLREVMVVEKRLLIVEELRITNRQVKTNTPQKVTLRKEEVNVDQVRKNQEDPADQRD